MSISRRGQEGFTYLLTAATLITVGAATMYGQVAHRAMKDKVSEYSETKRTLETINDALMRYAAREKKLPCPADGSLSTGRSVAVDATTGKCLWASGKNASYGVVPWDTLGLKAEEAIDQWKGRISYRVFDGRSAAPANDVSVVGPGGVNLTKCYIENSTTTNKATPVAGDVDHCVRHGLVISNPAIPDTATKNTGFAVSGTLDMDPAAETGAVVVLISHGENGRGAWLNSGKRAAAVATGDELANTSQTGPFVAKVAAAPTAPTPFDDIVVAVTLKQVGDAARLEPRKEPCLVDVYACYVLSLDPVAYWRLGEASTNATAADIAGHGTAKNGVYQAGAVRGSAGVFSDVANTSATFTSHNHYVSVPHPADNADGTNDFNLASGAISLWYRPSDTGPSDMNLFEKGTFRIWIDRTYTYFISGTRNVRRPAGHEGAWHHLVINWGPADVANGIPAGMKIFVDGASTTPNSHIPTLVGNTSAIQIGGDGNSNNYTGRIDEVAIFPRQLTNDQVNKLRTIGGSISLW